MKLNKQTQGNKGRKGEGNSAYVTMDVDSKLRRS
jgi:hypothetical protein